MEIGTTESKTELKEATDGDRYNRQWTELKEATDGDRYKRHNVQKVPG